MEIVSKPVARVTLREQAAAALRDLVVEGTLEPGSRINEVQLAAELGISRGPLREAIQGLAREGLLEVIQHRGAFVRAVGERTLRDLYGMRVALETFAVRVVTAQATDEQRAELERLVSEAEAALEVADGYPNDRDFHRALLRMADNEILMAAAEDVQQRISVARARSARDPERARIALGDHRQILEAIVAGDATLAESRLETHLWHSFHSAVSTISGK